MLFLDRLLKPRKRYATSLISEHAFARSLTLDLGVKFHCVLSVQCHGALLGIYSISSQADSWDLLEYS